jgi:PKHD-type hydroxylase
MALSNFPNEKCSVTYPYITWSGTFSEDELVAVQDYCNSLPPEQASIIGGDDPTSIRVSSVKFHTRTEDNYWIFDRFNTALTEANDQFYGFDLNGYDAFQYTEYYAEQNGNYNWHIDMILGRSYLPQDMIQPRKLSMSFLLNDDFEGGEFQIAQGGEDTAETVQLTKGQMVIFPSFITHRVTPVTKGTRKSLVIWVRGPKFI